MQLTLPEEDARLLDALKGRLSGVAWIRGAVRLAAADSELARRIADAAPDTGHGGRRPGAGRPRKVGAGNEPLSDGGE